MNCLTISTLILMLQISTIPNGGFEKAFTDWNSLWTRDANVGKLAIERETVHSGKYSARIEHQGENDWSLTSSLVQTTRDGDIYTLQGWVKTEGEGTAEINVIARDSHNDVVDWSYGPRRITGTHDWTFVQSKFVISSDIKTIQPRLIGYGPLTVWFDDFDMILEGNTDDYLGSLPDQLPIQNDTLSVRFHTDDGTISVLDKRNQKTWNQVVFANDAILTQAKVDGNTISTDWLYLPTSVDLHVLIELDNNQAECLYTIEADGELTDWFSFPQPFESNPGEYLVIPMNEGISYPVDDTSIDERRLITYGGHGICMPFWGVTDGNAAHMAIFETPNDAAILIERLDGDLSIIPQWVSQKGSFGYSRKIRYCFIDQGDHVEICKRYRQYAKDVGLFKTLEEKRNENPNVDLLVGAVNVWNWESNTLSYITEMQSLGIDHIQWSHRESSSVIDSMNKKNVLSSRYDIFQDVMNPDNFQYLNGVHPDWPTEAWPDDLMMDQDGEYREGWKVKAKDGSYIPCHVLCDKQAPITQENEYRKN
jgi:hypothetical protein